MTLKQKQQVAVNDYLLEMNYLRTEMDVYIMNGFGRVETETRFNHGMCNYFSVAFQDYTLYTNPSWIVRYNVTPPDSNEGTSWGTTPAYTRGTLPEILEALQIRVNNLLKELGEL